MRDRTFGPDHHAHTVGSDHDGTVGSVQPPAHAGAVGSGPLADLGAELAAMREDRGLTVEAVANSARLSPPTVRRIEAGAHRTTGATLARILQALGIDDHDDQQRHLDPWRMLLTDLRRDLHAGARTILEAAAFALSPRSRRLPEVPEVPGVTFASDPLLLPGRRPALPPIVGWDPDQGDAFRTAVNAAHHRDADDQARKMRRQLERAGMDPERIEAVTGQSPRARTHGGHRT